MGSYVLIIGVSNEVASNAEWRSSMLTARKAAGLTQADVARAVHCSQVVISNIENGKIVCSEHILPISRLLGIPAPMYFADELERRWVTAGAELRRTQPEFFESQLESLERLRRQEK